MLIFVPSMPNKNKNGNQLELKVCWLKVVHFSDAQEAIGSLTDPNEKRHFMNTLYYISVQNNLFTN